MLTEIVGSTLGLARVDRGEAVARGLAQAPVVGEAGWAPARAAARAAGGVPPLLVLRTLNFCPAMDFTSRRFFNAQRCAAFGARAVAAFAAAFGPQQVLVWDVEQMGRALPLDRAQGMAARCASQHANSEDMDIQVQVLLNALCN